MTGMRWKQLCVSEHLEDNDGAYASEDGGGYKHAVSQGEPAETDENSTKGIPEHADTKVEAGDTEQDSGFVKIGRIYVEDAMDIHYHNSDNGNYNRNNE